jgi:hypothetical protein
MKHFFLSVILNQSESIGYYYVFSKKYSTLIRCRKKYKRKFISASQHDIEQIIMYSVSILSFRLAHFVSFLLGLSITFTVDNQQNKLVKESARKKLEHQN